jgi:hypothetical protein
MGPRQAHQSEEDISEFLFLLGRILRGQKLIDLGEDIPLEVLWSDSNAFDQAFNAHRNASLLLSLDTVAAIEAPGD